MHQFTLPSQYMNSVRRVLLSLLLCCIAVSVLTLGPVAETQAKQGQDFLYVNGALHVFKVRANDGKVVWTSPELPDRVTYDPLLVGSHEVVVYNYEHIITVLEKETGKIRWQKRALDTDVPGYIVRVLGIKKNQLYVRISEYVNDVSTEKLVAFDINTGAQKWQYVLPNDINVTELTNQAIVLTQRSGQITALAYELGHVIWEVQVVIPTDNNVYNTQIVSRQYHLYVGFTFANSDYVLSGQLIKFETLTGKKIWQNEVQGSINIPSYQPQVGIVYSSTRAPFGELYSIQTINDQTGNIRWSTAATFIQPYEIAVKDDTVYAQLFDGKAIIYTLATQTGQERWTWGADPSGNHNGEVSSFAFANGRLFVHAITKASGVNAMHALNRQGKVVWQHAFESGEWIHPVTTGHSVYGGTIARLDGQSTLYSFKQENGAVQWTHTFNEVLEQRIVLESNR